jgi:hypothetical protein
MPDTTPNAAQLRQELVLLQSCTIGLGACELMVQNATKVNASKPNELHFTILRNSFATIPKSCPVVSPTQNEVGALALHIAAARIIFAARIAAVNALLSQTPPALQQPATPLLGPEPPQQPVGPTLPEPPDKATEPPVVSPDKPTETTRVVSLPILEGATAKPVVFSCNRRCWPRFHCYPFSTQRSHRSA